MQLPNMTSDYDPNCYVKFMSLGVVRRRSSRSLEDRGGGGLVLAGRVNSGRVDPENV